MTYPKTIINFSKKELVETSCKEEVLLRNGQCEKEDLSNLVFYHCRLINLNARESVLQNSSFFSSILEQVDFAKAVVSGVNFHTALLDQVDFSGADLHACLFYRANLSGVKFTQAKLANCSFTDAILEGVDFCGADLSNQNLKDAFSLKGATFDQSTKLPFSKSEAYLRGMIQIKPKFLSLVKESPEVSFDGKIIVLRDRKKNALKQNMEQEKTPAKVLSLTDYLKNNAE